MFNNDLTYQMAMMQLEMEMQLANQRAKQRQAQQQRYGYSSPSTQQSGGGEQQSGFQMPPGVTTLAKNIFSNKGGGYGGVGNVAAIIALQHELSNATGKNRQFEGVQTDDIFSSNLGGAHFATEPWAAFSFDKLGINAPTSGEKFDAAVENKDWTKAAGRLPGAASHYLEPSSSLSYDILQDDKFGNFGKYASKIAFPWRWAMDLFD